MLLSWKWSLYHVRLPVMAAAWISLPEDWIQVLSPRTGEALWLLVDSVEGSLWAGL